jgi:DNA-binding transcriptional LysR family regulator
VTFEDLRVFNAVYEQQNLSGVARRLGCTQPAVAQHVARLERELGVALLERTRRGVIPTGAGHLLYQATSAGLGALSLALREIQRLRDGGAGRLSIATGGTTVRHFLREAVIQFRRRHPEATLHFEPGSSSQQCLEAVARRAADMAFVTMSGDLRGFETRPLMEHPLVLLVRRGDPLAAVQRLRVRDLRGMRYISLPESTSSHRLVTEALAAEGITLAPTATVDDFDTAHLFVELGFGQAIVPAVQGWSFERTGRVRALPIQGLPPVPVGWATRSFRLLPPVAFDFMDILVRTTAQWKGIPGVKITAGGPAAVAR